MTTIQQLIFYKDIMTRIVEESLEVAFILCNAELPEFTIGKFFDIFNQILPSAFNLCTGYWPYYNSVKKQSICVCARFGLYCRHFKHTTHWIDLEELETDYSHRLKPKLYGPLVITNYEVELIPIIDACAGYTLRIVLNFSHKKVERGRPKRKNEKASMNLPIEEDNNIPFFIFCRYNCQLEYYPALQTIVFEPSPLFAGTYGTHFTNLIKMRQAYFQNNFLSQQDKFFTIPQEQVANFTLVLQHVNLPLFANKKQTIALLVDVSQVKTKPPKQSRTKSTQTLTSFIKDQENEEKEVEKYMNMLQTFKPIWNQYPLHTSESTMYNYPLLSSQIEESTVQEITPTIENSVEFDNQFPRAGYQKAVSRSAKYNTASIPVTQSPVPAPKRLYRDVLLSNTSKNKNSKQVCANSSKDFSLEQCSLPPISRNAPNKRRQHSNNQVVATTSRISTNVFSLTLDSDNDLDFDWFEKQFPTERSQTVLQTENEISEKLRMIDEVIEEDTDQPQENFYWWCEKK